MYDVPSWLMSRSLAAFGIDDHKYDIWFLVWGIIYQNIPRKCQAFKIYQFAKNIKNKNFLLKCYWIYGNCNFLFIVYIKIFLTPIMCGRPLLNKKLSPKNFWYRLSKKVLTYIRSTFKFHQLLSNCQIIKSKQKMLGKIKFM